MQYSEDIKERARDLRKQGYSRKAISDEINVPESTVQYWLIHTASVIKEDPQPQPIDEQNHYLRRRNADLQGENKRLRTLVGEQREIASSIAAAVSSQRPYQSYQPIPFTKSSKPVTPVFVWSDWHIGEVIDSEETESFGYFNFEIAEERIFKFVDDFVRYCQTQRDSYKIEEVVICSVGDMISGDIHKELSVTNEFPVPVQTAKAGLLQAEAIRRIASHFSQVRCYLLSTDNHGRLEKKPQYKQRAINSWGYLHNVITACSLEGIDNVECHISRGIKELVTISGWKFLLEHGNECKAWMGIPYYGMQRAAGREAMRRMNTSRGFHYQVIGHFHVPSFIENRIVVNGCLSGTTEFDHGQGRNAAPSQVAFFVHPEHGVFNLTPFVARTEVNYSESEPFEVKELLG